MKIRKFHLHLYQNVSIFAPKFPHTNIGDHQPLVESKYEGNVYVLDHPICDNKWNGNSAKVACKMLGFDPDYLKALPWLGKCEYSYCGLGHETQEVTI